MRQPFYFYMDSDSDSLGLGLIQCEQEIPHSANFRRLRYDGISSTTTTTTTTNDSYPKILRYCK